MKLAEPRLLSRTWSRRAGTVGTVDAVGTADTAVAVGTAERIRTIDLDAGYGGVPMVRGLNLHVDAGEVVALLGPNGAGKTTALLTIAGAVPAVAGEVRFDGRPAPAGLEARARGGMALLCDDRSVFRNLTVAENLRLDQGDPHEAVRLFPPLEHLWHRQVGLLSGGEQQMLGLGRAMARRPRLLLADELSLGLAPMVVRELLRAIGRLAETGTAVLLVEQQVRLVTEVCTRAYVLRRGTVHLTATAAELRADSRRVERSYLGSDD